MHKPAFLPGRSLERVPTFGIPAMTSPFAGSALVYWDNGPVRPDGSTGNGPTPFANTPPREGKDPHGAPRNTPAARDQKSQFLLTGNVVDVCGGAPCTSDYTTALGRPGRGGGRPPSRPRSAPRPLLRARAVARR